jgi:hypothetical protein
MTFAHFPPPEDDEWTHAGPILLLGVIAIFLYYLAR